MAFFNGRKNCAAISYSIGVSEKKLYYFLAESKINAFDFYKKHKKLKFSQRVAKSRKIKTKNGVSF